MKIKIFIIELTLGLAAFLVCAKSENLRSKVTLEKLHHKYRPVKQTALWEKPLTEEDAVVPDDTDADENSGAKESFPFDFDWDNLFKTSRRGTTRIRDIFSEVWSELFPEKKNGTIATGANEVSVETPEENTFFNGILDLMKPWWKGPNVCTREEETEDEDDENFGSSLVTSCHNIRNAYKCTMKIGKDGKVKVRTLIYECCHGWTRSAGQKGCTQRLALIDMISALREMNLTRFIETMEEVGLNAKLTDTNLTAFVPTNEALSAVTDSDQISFVLLETSDKMQFVKEILLGHLLAGWHFSHEWTDEMTLPTEKEGTSVRINFYSYPLPFATVNCARIVSADKQTKGGLIHTIDRVIMPARQTIYEILGQDTRFSIFTLLIGEELREKLLDRRQHLTVLAFTDEEFQKLPSEKQAKIRNKETCFTNYTEQVILPYTICSSSVQSDAVVRNLAGKFIGASRIEEDGGEKIYFGGIKVEIADRIATNGIIHVMKGVVLLQDMINSIEVAEKKDGEVFAELLKTSGLATELPNPVTLFVPSNEVLLDANLTETEKVETLKNHIADNLVVISRTEAGKQLSVKVQRPRFFFPMGRNSLKATVGCARVVKSNMNSCDGVIHFIDRVLSVPKQSLLEYLRGKSELSEFVSLLEIGGIDTVLNSGNFTGTILAPSNSALDKHLSAEVKERLLQEPEKLKVFLKQHVLIGNLCCHDFVSAWWFEPNRFKTLAGTNIFSSGTGQNARIGGAFLRSCDKLATNGIVHIVDRPIIRRRVTSILDAFSSNGFSRNNHRNSFNWNIDWPF